MVAIMLGCGTGLRHPILASLHLQTTPDLGLGEVFLAENIRKKAIAFNLKLLSMAKDCRFNGLLVAAGFRLQARTRSSRLLAAEPTT